MNKEKRGAMKTTEEFWCRRNLVSSEEWLENKDAIEARKEEADSGVDSIEEKEGIEMRGVKKKEKERPVSCYNLGRREESKENYNKLKPPGQNKGK